MKMAMGDTPETPTTVAGELDLDGKVYDPGTQDTDCTVYENVFPEKSTSLSAHISKRRRSST